MTDLPHSEEAFLRRLPLPLAQLCRRAHNAKSTLERYLTAYYLWEAALKLLASVLVVEFAESGPASPDVAERLKNLARPALGHWWEFVRLLLPVLAESDEAIRRQRELLLGRPRSDCPRAAGLDAVLRAVLENKPGARNTVQFGEMFGRLVNLRNEDVGHGAAGQRAANYYERMAPALLSGVTEVVVLLDVLAGRRLVHVADVRRLGSGAWLVERYDLSAGSMWRMESLEVPETDAARLPRPGRLYLQGPGDAWRSLHPLVVFDHETERVFFLNARLRRQRAEYLCYTTGEVVKRDELGQEQRELLAWVLGGPVDGAALAAWAERSRADEPSTPAEATPRRTLGEFELISRLGQGGMGVVYRAWQPSLGRQVALKCLLRSGDPKAEARFAREILALGRVDHPHLVKVFTSGSDGDQWFYAMELVEGADLAAVCTHLSNNTLPDVSEADWQAAVSTVCEQQRKNEQALDSVPSADKPAALPDSAGKPGRSYLARVVEVVRQVAEASHALHEANVIHRDIKPGNIVLSAGGDHAILLDLGLVQLSDETEGRLTQTRQFVGTLRYASPEQLLAAKLDRRADVYSLGATLWELLTLRPLFGVTDQTPTPELMLKIQTSDPTPVRKHNARVPADLDAIVMKCLEKDRSRRFATAADLAADLGRWQRGEPVQAQPPSLRYLLGKQLRRYRVPLSAAAALILAAMVGIGLAFLQIKEAKDAAEGALGKEKTALGREREALGVAQTKEKETAEVLAQQKKLLADAARLYAELASREFEKENTSDAINWMLRAYEAAPADDPLRPSYRTALGVWGHRLERRFVHDGPVLAVAFSPDGRTILTGSAANSARIWDMATARELVTLVHKDSVNAVAFNPDGRTVLTACSDGTARLWTAKDGREIASFSHGELGPLTSAAFSPDGRTVLTGSWDKTARLWDVATGKEIAVFPHDQVVLAVAFHPDGGAILTGDAGWKARLWDTRTRKELASFGHGDEVRGVAFSPDGRYILTGTKWGARHWGTASASDLFRIKNYNDPVQAAAFSPDGRTYLTGGQDGTARWWDTKEGKELALFRHTGPVYAVAFSPDGHTILTGGEDGTARAWEAAPRPGELAVLRHEDEVTAVAYSRDSRFVITGGNDKAARLWETATGKELLVLQHAERVKQVTCSPNGRTVLTLCADGSARVWDAASGKELADFPHERAVTVAVYGPDGNTVFTGSEDQTARFWDVATGKELVVLRQEKPVHSVACSPDGRTLLTGSKEASAHLWDATTGRELRSFPLEDQLDAVAFSLDGRSVLTVSRHEGVVLWDSDTGKKRATISIDQYVRSLSFSPDNRSVLLGTGDILPFSRGFATLCDLDTGKELATFQYSRAVWGVGFSPDSRMLMTAGEDARVRLWDAALRKPLATFDCISPVRTAAFSPDGRSVLTGSVDHTARLWEVPAPAPDQPARVRAWVGVRTQKSFDERGDLRSLSRPEWLERVRQLEAHGGDWVTAPDDRRWHRYQAAEAEAAGQWFTAAFHLRRLLAGRTDRELFERLGTALYRDGQYTAAIECLTGNGMKQSGGVTIPMQLVLALAHHRLGQQAAGQYAIGLLAVPHGSLLPVLPVTVAHDFLARSWLSRAIEQIEQSRNASAQDRTRWDRLRKEAESLLLGLDNP